MQQFKERNEVFGCLNVILMGDLLQLKPCKGECRIFEKPYSLSVEMNLWDAFSFHELSINQRQKGDIVYGELCCRIREGVYTADDICMLESRLLENLNNAQEFDFCVGLENHFQ